MTAAEQAFTFGAGPASLIGVLHHAQAPGNSRGVVVVVGGPQYRVGSHRQFVLLARALAQRPPSAPTAKRSSEGAREQSPRLSAERIPISRRPRFTVNDISAYMPAGESSGTLGVYRILRIVRHSASDLNFEYSVAPSSRTGLSR